MMQRSHFYLTISAQLKKLAIRSLLLLSLAAFVPIVYTASVPRLVSAVNVFPRVTLEGNLISNTDFGNLTIAPWFADNGYRGATWQLTTKGCYPGQCIQANGPSGYGYGQTFSQTVTVQADKRYTAVIYTAIDYSLTQCRVKMLWDGKEMITYTLTIMWSNLARDMPVSTTTSRHTFGIRMNCVGASGKSSWIKIDRIYLIPSVYKWPRV
ncbi:hypothetical protein GGP41_001016 [Bipolaris sorokiniana]|uniref:Uncharacterized protein n=1 Tax=Cochliobolus sativus TaxID=45130 RepID=A0A8H5ZNS8_COCSA|nr:hypothetical protein GGP41_001016 [Bipolaris sorokiniana]